MATGACLNSNPRLYQPVAQESMQKNERVNWGQTAFDLICACEAPNWRSRQVAILKR